MVRGETIEVGYSAWWALKVPLTTTCVTRGVTRTSTPWHHCCNVCLEKH